MLEHGLGGAVLLREALLGGFTVHIPVSPILKNLNQYEMKNPESSEIS